MEARLITSGITICQVLHTLGVGGAEILAARLACQLRDQYRFVFICLDELGSLGKELRSEGFTVHVLERRSGVDWRCSLRMARLFKRERVHVVQAHQYTPFFYSLTARLLCTRLPVLFTEHGRHQPDYPRRKRILVNRLLLRRYDRVVAVGEAVRQALIANEGIPAQRIQVIYNGIDVAAFHNGVAAREPVRKEIGIGTQDLLVTQVARLDYLKDHGTALRTLREVTRQNKNVRLAIVGDGPEKPKIDALIRELEIQDYVRLLGTRKDVPRLLAASDILLLSSVSEGIPLTLIEGMAASLPVVSTQVGGVAEVVADGQAGWLAPAGNAEALADRILCLAADPGLRARMGQVGRQRAEQMFSEKQMHAAYDMLYQEMYRQCTRNNS